MIFNLRLIKERNRIEYLVSHYTCYLSDKYRNSVLHFII